MLPSSRLSLFLAAALGMGDATIRPALRPSLGRARHSVGRTRRPGQPKPAGSKLAKAAERRRIGISNIH